MEFHLTKVRPVFALIRMKTVFAAAALMAFLMAAVLPCQAASRTRLRVEWARLENLIPGGETSAAAAGLQRISKPARIRGYFPPLGAFRAVLKIKRFKNWPSFFKSQAGLSQDKTPLALLRGTWRSAGTKAMPLAATLWRPDHNLHLKLLFHDSRPIPGTRRLYEIDTLRAVDAAYKTRLRSRPQSVLQNKSLGNDTLEPPSVGRRIAPASFPGFPLPVWLPGNCASWKWVWRATTSGINSTEDRAMCRSLP